MNIPGLVAKPPHVLKYAPGASLSRALLEAFLSILWFFYIRVALLIQLWGGLKNSFSASCWVNTTLLEVNLYAKSRPGCTRFD